MQLNGEGKWLFPSGNEVCGEYHQSVAEGDEDPAVGEEEEETDKKARIEVKWQTHPHLFDSAFAINRVL